MEQKWYFSMSRCAGWKQGLKQHPGSAWWWNFLCLLHNRKFWLACLRVLVLLLLISDTAQRLDHFESGLRAWVFFSPALPRKWQPELLVMLGQSLLRGLDIRTTEASLHWEEKLSLIFNDHSYKRTVRFCFFLIPHTPLRKNTKKTPTEKQPKL